MSDINYMDIAEFREEGYLQEINRRFLHPLGLALEVVVEDDGTEHLGGVWDYRDDPEGISYDDGSQDRMLKKARYIWSLWKERQKPREDAIGYMIQPIFMVKEEE